MMKNLKKVISAIAALAISASSFVALAAGFPDVPATADYAKAVDELTALNIVNGYEDGTFGPDKLVTRAEITKMIVAALGSTKEAESAAGRNTAFTDVTGNHWAAGYVTVGTSSGSFINGMGDGTFAPDANVTYAQAVKMLVSAIGYQTWAESAGGYPQGYLSYGSQLDITDGVNVGNDTELNRGQVAMLIDNALDAPLLVKDGYYDNIWGQSVPNLTQMDGQVGDYHGPFASLLTNNHDAYKVYGQVINTPRTGNATPADEVQFEINKANKWGDYSLVDNAKIKINAYYGETAAPEYLYTFSEVIVKEVAGDEWEIISITPTAKNQFIEIDANDVDITNLAADLANNQITVYTNENKTRTTTYNLDKDDKNALTAAFHVNGVDITSAKATTDAKALFEDNAGGVVTLIDVPKSGEGTDNRYDHIMITYYEDAVIDSVVDVDSTRPTIYFDDYGTGLDYALELELENVDKIYDFSMDGAPIELADLQAGDVVSVAYNYSTGFANSKFFDVVVSRNVVTGTVTSTDNDGISDFYEIDGTFYEGNASFNDKLEPGNEYSLYLNAFGKIVASELGASAAANVAILDSVYVSGDETYVSIIDQTGNKSSYVLRNLAQAATAKTIVYANGTSGAKNAVQNRVIEYSLNTANELAIKNVGTDASPAYTLTPQASANGTTDVYRASTNRLGSIKLGDSTAVVEYVVDATTQEVEYGLATPFVEDLAYEAYAYDKATMGDKAHRFVIVTKGARWDSIENPMVIFASQGTTSNDDYDSLNRLKVYMPGEDGKSAMSYLLVADDYTLPTLKEGTPFIYGVDSEGYVNKVEVLFDAAVVADLASDSAFTDEVFTKAAADTNGSFDSALSTYAKAGITIGSDKAEFHFGPIIDETSNSIFLGALNAAGKTQTNIEALVDYSYDTDVVVTVMDYSLRRDKVSPAAIGSVVATPVANSAWADADETLINWAHADSPKSKLRVNYALVKTVNDDVTEIFVILANKN